jgi:hypothetical protein
MKKNYTFRIAFSGLLLSAITSLTFAQKEIIQLVGANPYESIEPADQVLMDSISKWVEVKYASQDEFNSGDADTLYSKINGVIFFESCGSYALGNFGSRDEFPVPSITMEAGVFQNDADNPNKYWNQLSENGGIWGYGGDACEAVDLQWKIVGDDHPILKKCGLKNNDIVTWSVYPSPADYGIPYLHHLTPQVKVLATAARSLAGDVEGYVQNDAMSMFEITSEKCLFMNTAKKFLEPGNGTKVYYNVLHQAVLYMFVPSSLSVSEIRKDASRLTAWPNPAKDEISVSFNAIANRGAVLSLYNATGQRVISREFRTINGYNRVNFTLNGVPAGIYFLKLQTGVAPSCIKVQVK